MASILIIDDEKSLRITFETFLAKEGHAVLKAWDYESTMKILAQTRPDVIFADIVLPGGKNGLDILREVRRQGLNCPVIMITGKPGIDTAAKAVREGAFDYVAKPVRREMLIGLTRAALQVYALEEEKRLIEAEKDRYRRHLEAIFISVDDAIITVDGRKWVTAANAACQKVCGVSADDLIDKAFASNQNECLIKCQHTLDQTLGQQTSFHNLRVEFANAEGRRRVVVMNSSPLMDAEDNFIGAVLVIRDKTRENRLERELEERFQFSGIIGKNSKMQQIYTLLEDLADTDTTVLITGESGVGKELIANALHYGSHRASGPLVKVNCSALAESLLESELFGHVRGAFTGAVRDKKGRFELAHGGTLFLDEIGDIHPRIQIKLLRVLQERAVERVGAVRSVNVDVRIVAATHQDLKAKIRQGLFREDLYYRLMVLEINLPPLRERRDDIPLLTSHFITTFNKSYRKVITGVSPEVLKLFMNHPWRGNVRELQHAIEHAFVLCREGEIALEHLPAELGSSPASTETQRRNVKIQSPQDVIQALKATGWNKAKAARRLGVSRQTLYRKIAEYDIREQEL